MPDHACPTCGYTHPNLSSSYLTDDTDEHVRAALQRSCSICKAKPGVVCRHPFECDEPLNRVVHQARAEAAIR